MTLGEHPESYGISERREKSPSQKQRGWRSKPSKPTTNPPPNSFVHPSNAKCPPALSPVLGTRDARTETPGPLRGLAPGLEVRQRRISSGPLPPCFSSLLLPPWALLSFVAGPVPPSARLCSAASRKGLVQAEHAGFGEQSRVWFQHLIQFVLPRLKYEMVASQTFKGRRRESERLLKFKF